MLCATRLEVYGSGNNVCDAREVRSCRFRRIQENLDGYQFKLKQALRDKGEYSLVNPAHGRAACGMLWMAESTNPLAEKMNWATSPTPFVIFDAVKTFAWPSSTSFFMCIYRLVGCFSSVKISLALKVEASRAFAALRTIVRILT